GTEKLSPAMRPSPPWLSVPLEPCATAQSGWLADPSPSARDPSADCRSGLRSSPLARLDSPARAALPAAQPLRPGDLGGALPGTYGHDVPLPQLLGLDNPCPGGPGGGVPVADIH